MSSFTHALHQQSHIWFSFPCMTSSEQLFFYIFPFVFILIFSFFSLCFGCVGHFLLSRDPAAAKLQLLVAEGGASSHSRLQRCMRRGRGLQQRMQLQQRQQQQDEEGQQLQEEPRYLLSQSEWKRLFGLAIK